MKRNRIWGVALLILLLNACGDTPTTVSGIPLSLPTVTPLNGSSSVITGVSNRIAFSQPSANGRWEIFTILPDGGGLTKLVSLGQDALSPAWSPDGQWLVYVSDAGGYHRQIRKMRADGSGDVALTGSASRNDYPVWSSNGQSIYFVTNRNYALSSTQLDVFVMNADGSEHRLIAANGSYVSENNGKVIFTRFNGRTHDLMFYDGATKVLVGDDEADFGIFAPNGNQIAYTKGWNNTRAVYLLGLDGKQSRLSGEGEIATDPSWSADGRYIAYLVQAGDNVWEINVVDTTNKQSKRILTTGGMKFYLSWGS